MRKDNKFWRGKFWQLEEPLGFSKRDTSVFNSDNLSRHPWRGTVYVSRVPTMSSGDAQEYYPDRYFPGAASKRSGWHSLVEPRVKESLASSFVKQCEKYPEFLKDHLESSVRVFYTLLKSLSKWQALTGKVSVTESPSLFFRSSFFGGYEMRFEVFLKDINAAFSIMRGKKLIVRNHGGLAEMLDEVEKFFYPVSTLTAGETATMPVHSSIIAVIGTHTSHESIHQLKHESQDTGFLEHAY